MKNFWLKLKFPIYALAPMAGVADSAFRQMCMKFGAQVVYSEMASATALAMNSDKTLELLEFDKVERPYVVQLFGSQAKDFAIATKIVTSKIKPDGIDINFGCPIPKVVKQGAGIALFKDIKRAREVIKAVTESTDLPVSIKTRTRVKEMDIIRFLDKTHDLPIQALMIHGRSGSEGFSGPVDYKTIKKAREVFSGIILANGGVGTNLTPDPSPSPSNPSGRQEKTHPASAPLRHPSREGIVKEYVDWLLRETGADGVGIAQGALGRPWIFKAVRTGQSVKRSPRAIKKVAILHTELVLKHKGESGIQEMRKHLSWYVKGLPGARQLRQQLVQVNSLSDVKKTLNSI